MAFRKGGSNAGSRSGGSYGSRSSGSNGSYGNRGGGRSQGASKGRGQKKQVERDNSRSAGIFLTEQDNGGGNYPVLKGFINLSPEFIEFLGTVEPDPEYGTVGLQVSLWDKGSGSIMGNVQFYEGQNNAGNSRSDEDEIDD